MRRVGQQRKKVSEWWSEVVGVVVAEERRALRYGCREEIWKHITGTGEL